MSSLPPSFSSGFSLHAVALPNAWLSALHAFDVCQNPFSGTGNEHNAMIGRATETSQYEATVTVLMADMLQRCRMSHVV